MARREQVIICENETLGKGEAHSPIRRLTSFYETDGTLIGHIDPCTPCEDNATGVWVFDRPVKIVAPAGSTLAESDDERCGIERQRLGLKGAE